MLCTQGLGGLNTLLSLQGSSTCRIISFNWKRKQPNCEVLVPADSKTGVYTLQMHSLQISKTCRRSRRQSCSNPLAGCPKCTLLTKGSTAIILPCSYASYMMPFRSRSLQKLKHCLSALTNDIYTRHCAGTFDPRGVTSCRGLGSTAMHQI